MRTYALNQFVLANLCICYAHSSEAASISPAKSPIKRQYCPETLNPVTTLATPNYAAELATCRVAYVYSSAHTDEAQVQASLLAYGASVLGKHRADDLRPRKISFRPGHRQKFWHRNCVAIGMSAGFLEPLEASALALVELSCTMLCDEMPLNRTHMDIISVRFNARFSYRW